MGKKLGLKYVPNIELYITVTVKPESGYRKKLSCQDKWFSVYRYMIYNPNNNNNYNYNNKDIRYFGKGSR